MVTRRGLGTRPAPSLAPRLGPYHPRGAEKREMLGSEKQQGLRPSLAP